MTPVISPSLKGGCLPLCRLPFTIHLGLHHDRLGFVQTNISIDTNILHHLASRHGTKRMTNETITIRVDDRLRLLSAALSATNFPEIRQQVKRHHAHAHARACAKRMHDKNMHIHPAILGLQGLLDDGVTLETLGETVMRFDWDNALACDDLPDWLPPQWNEHLWDFYQQSDLATFWQESAKDWDNALTQANKLFPDAHFREFLVQFIGDFNENFVFVPNICYPADFEVGLWHADALYAIVPPPLAWGDSPPWPFDEETLLNHSYRAALTQYGRLLLRHYLNQHQDKVQEASEKDMPISDKFKTLYPTWQGQFTALFVAAAVAIYMEDYMSSAEAKAYILMEKKARGMQELPGTVSVLRRYLQEKGHKFNELADFLSVFPAQLRVAKRIVTL
jgi:hypothetical protein